MKNIFRKSLLLTVACLMAGTMLADVMYVISSQCNVPLKAGMSSASYQIFTWDGTNQTATTAISCDQTNTAGFYYNSTSLVYADLTNTGNYSTSSGSSRTLRGIKLAGSAKMTITLNSVAIQKIAVIGRCASDEKCTINIAGETVTTNSKSTFFMKEVTPAQVFTNKIEINNTSVKEYNLFVYLIEGVAGPVAVTGVSLNKTSTSIEQGGEEQLTATVTPSNADNQNVSWSSDNASVASVDQTGKVSALSPGTATITVTTEDGNKTASCTVTVTAPAAPIPVTAINLNKSTATIYVGSTETLTVSYTPADANTGKAVNWTSNNTGVATVDANGTVTAVAVGTAVITATSTTDASINASCTVTVDVAHPTGVTLNKSSLNLQIGGNETLTATVVPANASDKSVTWSSSNTNVATVSNGKVSGVAAGTATITVTTVDGNKTATCTVTVTAGPPVPSTDLALHIPEVYEASDLAGGYNTPLVVVGGHEYEVYYINRDNSSNVTIATSNADKAGNICGDNGTSNNCMAKDGWARIASNGTGGDQNATAQDEFQTSIRSVKLNSNNHKLELHIKGYDQFSFYGKDNNTDASKGRLFEVYIDDVKQTRTPSDYAINRFNITTGEHVIRVTATGGSDSKLCSFSLRVAQEPRTKWLKGNDSSQVVLQTAAIRPVTYATKYNNLDGAETRLLWDGAEASGFELVKTDGTLSDTLQLSGVANCPTGTYHYRVAAFYNGIETSSVSGSFTVKSSLKATSDLSVDAYQNEDMEDPITFRYYALSASDVQLTWTGTVPDGISGSGNNGIYTISGRPTTIGIYPYSITVTGADTTFTGKVTVKELNMGNNPILYLHRNSGAAEKDPVFKYLTSSAGGSKNLIARKARRDGLRSADQYAPYKWILISEDADADNEEVLAIIRGGVNLPVFNMQGFTYATNRLGWGYPDNGTVDTTSHNGCNIYVQRNDHPIFSRFSVEVGDKLPIFEKVERNGIMPIAISGEAMQNTLCLATGYTRDIDEYDQDGELQTAIHEIPAAMRGGKKYICMPMAINANNKLSAHGKGLIDAIVAYLLDDNSAAPAVPELRINSFSIMGVAGTIDQTNNTIDMAFNVQEYPNLELNEVVPQITLADPTYTFVTPASGDTVDFQYSTFMPVKFVVSDFISSRVYNVIVRTYDPQGLENVYEVGEWVNIFDIYGRKIATTNEDIYTMELPHGVYLVVTENGQTIKLMR